MDLYKRQIEIEEQAIGLGVQRYRREQPMPWAGSDQEVKAKNEAEMSPGQELIRRSVEPLTKAIEETLEKALGGRAGPKHSSVKFLAQADPQALAYITARRIISGSSKQVRLQALAISLGGLVDEHIQLVAMAEGEDKGLLKQTEGKLKGSSGKHRRTIMRRALKLVPVSGEAWTVSDKLRVGEKLIDLFITSTGMAEIIRITGSKRASRVALQLTEKCKNWLKDAHGVCELLSPMRLPMVVPPKPWKTPLDGGYLSEGFRLPFVKTQNGMTIHELFSWDMPQVYDALNCIQAVGWRINKDVHKVLKEVWLQGGNLGGLPPSDPLPIPSRPKRCDTNDEAQTAWKAHAARVHGQNARFRSKRFALMQKLWIASEFEAYETIYFPHNLDFRGRVYPVVPLLNPQADDSGKALLQFAEGKPLGETGGYWLAIHVANVFGQDKLPLDKRVQWVLDNTEAILDSATQPLDGDRFWVTADKPWQALAACLEWKGAQEYGDEWVSRIPVALDGSCSGLQHFSALLRDPEGAAAVNLLPTDTPSDIYSIVAQKVEEKLKGSEDPLASVWCGKVTRAITKQPCMTYAYSATRYGMQEQILSTLVKLNQEGGKPYLDGQDDYEAAVFLSFIVHDVIRETVVAATTAMDWLRDVTCVLAQQGIPMRWTTPIQFPVVQNYRRRVRRQMKCFFGGQRIDLTVLKEKPKLAVGKQQSSIAPNYIHSLDAAHLMLTALACRENGITSLSLVHDSFGTHPCDVHLLGEILREGFAVMYQHNLLEGFRDEVLAQIPDELHPSIPPIPELGALDISKIHESDFCFA